MATESQGSQHTLFYLISTMYINGINNLIIVFNISCLNSCLLLNYVNKVQIEIVCQICLKNKLGDRTFIYS